MPKEKRYERRQRDARVKNERGEKTSLTSLGVAPLDVEDTLVEVAVREIAEKTGGQVEVTRATAGA